MANDTVWIVVPVYNAEKTLKKCIKSIQKQTYKNWKLILVDDGSPDNSGKICDEFAAKDSRIQVLHTENGGPGAARKKGIALVDGGYCCFLDSDDTLPVNAIEVLYNEIEKTGADLACGQMQRMINSVRFPSDYIAPCFSEPKCYTHDELMSELYISCFGISNFPTSLWAKIYKTDKIKPVMLSCCDIPQKFAEDLDVILRTLPIIDKLSVVDNVVYNYRVGGGTSRFMPEILSDSMFMYNRKKEHIKYYTGNMDAQRLISIELKNIAMTYFCMCERFQKFSQGSLEKEIRYVCSLPEMKEALNFIEGDTSGVSGAGDAMRAGEYNKVAELVRAQGNESGLKAMLKKVLARL